MAAYDLYGVKANSIEEAKEIIEQLLSVVFLERDSIYQGGVYYIFGEESGEHFLLKKNIDPIDGAAAEMEFPDNKLLLYVNETGRGSEVKKELGKGGEAVTLLRHEEL